MVKRAHPLFIVPFLLLCLPATAREVPIGTHGATITLDESWQRQTLNPDVGPDQFRKEGSIFAILLETRALLERRADFELQLEVFVSNIEVNFQGSEVDPLTRYQRNERVGHCTRRLLAQLPSVHLAYQFDLVSRDGLGYLVMTWTAASQAAQMYEVASRLAASITFPDAASEWGKTAEPTPHPFRFDEWKLELSYRESVFSGLEGDGEQYSLSSFEDDVAVHLFLDRYDDGNVEAGAALDEVVSVVREGSALEELERVDVELQAGKGRQALLRERSEHESYDLAVAMVQVAENTYVDLRLVSMGRTGHRERLWNDLLDSLKVTPPAQVDAFPVVDVAPVAEGAPVNQAASQLLANATRFETSGAFVHAAVVAGDGSVVVLDSRRVLKVDRDAEPEVLFRSEDWLGARRLAVAGDEILLVAQDQQVSAVAGRQLQPAGFDAAYAAAAGDGLVLVRAGRPPRMLGFDRLVSSEPSRVIERSADGGERTVAELGDLDVGNLAAGEDGSTVLLASEDRHLLGSEGRATDSTTRLLEVHLGTGEKRPLGIWKEIGNLAAADGGWLVSGAPQDGLLGLYLLAPDGERELLVSGDVSGVALRDGRLIFTTPVCLTPEGRGGEDHETCLYEADMELVREHGPGSWPLTADTVNRIAAELRRDGHHGFGTEAELSGLVRAADTACRRLTSQPLPSSPAAVDQMLEDLMGEASLSDDAVALLAAVTTDALLRGSAEWIGGSASASRIRGRGLVAGNHFAVAYHPTQVVLSTLYHDDGWWDPVRALLRQADGRVLLLGHDRQALTSAAGQRDQPAAAEVLRQDDLSGTLRLLAENRRNAHLRKRVYRHFAAAGRSRDLARLAWDFATAEPADADDLRAWLAARLSQAPEGPDLEPLIDDLKAAITAHPDEAAFYLLLGAAYERTSLADRLALARACYAKTVELAPWGELNDDAEQAVERIDEEG